MKPTSRKGGDSEHALIGQTKKGKGKGHNEGKMKSEELASQLGKKDSRVKLSASYVIRKTIMHHSVHRRRRVK